MRPQNLVTFPRSLHPGAWWVWALALAAAASRSQNPVPLLLILVVTGFVVAARRSDAPWARSYMAFLKLSLVLIVVRIAFQALLSSGPQGPTVLVTLPSLPMPVGSGLKLGGAISLEAVLRAFYEGLQLATILCLRGRGERPGQRPAAAALRARRAVRDRRGLRHRPHLRPAAGQRRRPGPGGAPAPRPERLRGPQPGPARDAGPGGGAGAVGRRSRRRWTHAATAVRRTPAGSPDGSPARSSSAGLLGVCVGVYGLLDATASAWLGTPTLVVSLAAAGAGLNVGGRRTGRTKYRPDPWALPEWLVSGSGVVAALAVFVDVHLHPADFYLASVTDLPAGAAAGLRRHPGRPAACGRGAAAPGRRHAPRRGHGRPAGWRWPHDRAGAGRRHLRGRGVPGAVRGGPEHPRGRAGCSSWDAPARASPPCCGP